MSDLHCDNKIRNEEKLIKIINSLEPDIIVFTGDAINTTESLDIFKKTMRSLKAKIGKYAIKGNLDINYWKDLNLFNNTGFILLEEETLEIDKDGEKILISGLSFGEKRN
ncbi:MAG: metallophosphoesterase [Candidatus Aenigmatarchaeota archaeon]